MWTDVYWKGRTHARTPFRWEAERKWIDFRLHFGRLDLFAVIGSALRLLSFSISFLIWDDASFVGLRGASGPPL